MHGFILDRLHDIIEIWVQSNLFQAECELVLIAPLNPRPATLRAPASTTEKWPGLVTRLRKNVVKFATLHCLFWILEPERSFKTLRSPWDMMFAFFWTFSTGIITRAYINVCISFLTSRTYLFVNWQNRNVQEYAIRLPESQRANPICHGRKLSIRRAVLTTSHLTLKCADT